MKESLRPHCSFQNHVGSPCSVSNPAATLRSGGMWINKFWTSQSLSWWKDGRERRDEPTCTEWRARPLTDILLKLRQQCWNRPAAPSGLRGRDRSSEQLSSFPTALGPVWAGAVVSTTAVPPICALSAPCTGHSQAEGEISRAVSDYRSSWSCVFMVEGVIMQTVLKKLKVKLMIYQNGEQTSSLRSWSRLKN